MANRLAGEKSPYLLQHADNPVDWYPWGEEALTRARQEQRPILVSIGYSACHWCHVMAHESFEDEATARLMNENFVNIKVDREERPDVDAIYMEAMQALTGQGGWPLNVFLTPDGRPFFGGTYFPPAQRYGMSSWRDVLAGVSRAYREQREDVLKNADVLTDYLRRAQNVGAVSNGGLEADILSNAYRRARAQFDWARGGLGGAPKFPQPLALELLLRMHRRLGEEEALRFAELTLRRMAEGGIFDQLGGGFHRYSVDDHWLVPHFEKMLYDNALLSRVYLHAFQITHDSFYRGIVERTLDYLLQEMRSPDGGFYSAEDADSEGVEGKYYVWTRQEMGEILEPDEVRVAALRYGVSEGGNFEGKTILTAALSPEQVSERVGLPEDRVADLLSSASATLLGARSNRIPPGKDTKILVSWNALAIGALAEAGRVLERADYLDAARQAADFILTRLRVEGRLMRSYRDGPSSIPAFLEDHAFLLEALISLYETSFEGRYLRSAIDVAGEVAARFSDDSGGAFFDTAADSESLVVRPRSFFDNPIPSGNSSASLGLLRLESLTGNADYGDQAVRALEAARTLLGQAPLGFPYLLCSLDFYLSRRRQVAILGDPAAGATTRLVREVFQRFLPDSVVAVGDTPTSPLLEERHQVDSKPTAFVCEQFACKLPVTDPESLAAQLDSTQQKG